MNTTQTNKSEVALREEAVLAFWHEHDIFTKSLDKEAPQGDFVFYDGPPFATGLPHYGHILAGTIKDTIPRFWTMNGYRVRRKWGWDCHGLPLENLIEKKLGLATKRDIEEYGVKNFNEAARDAVMEYADDWKRIIPRMGRFADMEDDYKTMDSSYTESVWWVFKSLHEKGLVYEGFKSMHLCPRCGTTLSNFEVNQGYKDVKDISVYVELPLVDEKDTSLLVWTTTPWTLPGNMAAAVHKDYDYVVIEKPDEGTGPLVRFVLAKERLEAVFGTNGYEIVRTLKGSELVGKRYEPPFAYWQQQEFAGKAQAWQILHADYVELGEEGTGAVHLAPAYGADDMELAQAHGVPIVHHVTESGHFMDFVTDFAGQLVKPKDDDDSGVTHLDADIEIVKALKASGRLFQKENITHSYPHCWRCDTPLLNYATNSWFVEVTKIKDQLVAENSKVAWVPEHVGTNRFGKWLEGARDWAVSRQRYWGAPLPVWRNPETKEYKVFGSLPELQEYVPKSGNTYFTVRHAEAESNITHTISTDITAKDQLTEKGITQAKKAAESLQGCNIDLIVASPFNRTRHTASIIQEALGLAEETIVYDERLQEMQLADELQSKEWSVYGDRFSGLSDQFTTKPDGVLESRQDIQRRTGELLFEIEQKYQGKNILFVGHKGSLFALASAAQGYDPQTAMEFKKTYWPENAQHDKLEFVPFPHNDHYELDFHRPYIDDIVLEENGVRLERVPDVFDCWFESGSMPYGQHHYPFALEEQTFLREHFPAQFIAEGLDQTRGWFYSLMVLGTALFGKSPFENVIVNGLVLAEDGRKMSKSLQNYPDPMDVADSLGVDAMRYYLLSSSIMRAEDLNFSEASVQELQRKNIGRLHNVLSMYEMFQNGSESRSDSEHILDRWIIARLNQLIAETTAGFRSYELDKATRPITDFIDDLSVWYLRRSRDRLKQNPTVDPSAALQDPTASVTVSDSLRRESVSQTDSPPRLAAEDQLTNSVVLQDKQDVLGTLRFVLEQLSLVMAPSMPFYAEHLWQAVKADTAAESVHLAMWPEAGAVDDALLTDMQSAREVVRQALEARVQADLKVRQPIETLWGPSLAPELQAVILEEVNAKQYAESDTVSIDTTITPELKAEGDARELMRAIQSMRKEAGLQAQDEITLTIQTSAEGESIITAHHDNITQTVGARELVFDRTEGTEITAGEHSFTVSLHVE